MTFYGIDFYPGWVFLFTILAVIISNNRNKLFHQLIILNKFSGKLKLIYQKHMMTKKLKIYWNVNDNLGNEFVWDVDEDSLFFLIEG